METTYQILLVTHIIGGFLALAVAPIAMALKKGGQGHRFWGKLFFWSITVVAFTAVVMSIWKSNIFLAMVGVFSFYLVASGYRSLYRRKMNAVKDVAMVDWILVLVSGLFCAAMMVLGVVLLYKNPSSAFGYISTIFGMTGSGLIWRDIRSFTVPGYYSKKWLNHHIAGMVGGYIATVSAFSVVNLEFIPDSIRWLWPTIIGVPLLVYQINSMREKHPQRPELTPCKCW